jgi:hypothetical protein
MFRLRRVPGGHRARLFAPLLLVALVALFVGAVPSQALAATTVPSPGVIPPWANPYGRTYSQWSAAQWQWEIQSQNIPANGQAVDPNPGTPNQPEAVDCAVGQSGHVWFLLGISAFQSYSTAYRSCTIPTGVGLFFPVIDNWQDNLPCPGQPPGTLTADGLRQAVQQVTDSIVPGSMAVTIDGRSVGGLADSSTAYRAAAGPFFYTLPGNNALSAFCPGDPLPAGTMPPAPGAFADGVYIMLAPLSAGVHHLNLTGATSSGPSGPFSENVSYTITVQP